MTEPVIRLEGVPTMYFSSDGSATVRVPIRLRRRSGQRRLRPANVLCAEPSADLTTMQLALARGFRWREILDAGEAASMKDIAASENTDHSYVARMINMTLLAPEIIEAILDDTLPDIRLTSIAISPPDMWDEQLAELGMLKKADDLAQPH